MQVFQFFLIFILSPLIFAGEVALTFDDAPMSDGQVYTGLERTAKIIKILDKHKVKSAIFVNSSRLKSKNGNQRMLSFVNAGHIIANHTHSHPRLSSTSLKEYIKDIKLADEALSKYATFKKWFRYPYLNEGNTIKKRDQVRKFLTSNGYINGYATADNLDYFINGIVQNALRKGEKVDLKKACTLLIDITLEGLNFYEKIAKKYIGQVRHVLLMHENDLEAFCLDRLITVIKEKGWKIVSPELAFSDPLLKDEPDTLYLGYGRIAAKVHLISGKKFKAKWENTSVLKEEFDRRNILTKQKL